LRSEHGLVGQLAVSLVNQSSCRVTVRPIRHCFGNPHWRLSIKAKGKKRRKIEKLGT